MIKTIALALALLTVGAAPALAVPFCNGGGRPGVNLNFGIQFGQMTDTQRAQLYEQQLNARGIEAQQTRFWNGCIQTFVRENGHITMRFYDPSTLEEVY